MSFNEFRRNCVLRAMNTINGKWVHMTSIWYLVCDLLSSSDIHSVSYLWPIEFIRHPYCTLFVTCWVHPTSILYLICDLLSSSDVHIVSYLWPVLIHFKYVQYKGTKRCLFFTLLAFVIRPSKANIVSHTHINHSYGYPYNDLAKWYHYYS